MATSSTDGPDAARPPQRRVLAVGSGLVAASAYLGTLGLAGVRGAAGRRLDAQLPLGSRRLACAALVTVVAVPHTVAAWYAWRGDRRADPAATAAGGLLLGWIGVQKVVLEDSSFLQPVYAGVGALMVAAGRRRWALGPPPTPATGRVSGRAAEPGMLVEGGIEIHRSPEVVFDTVADQRNEPRYNPRLRAVTKTTARPVGVGTRFRAEAVTGPTAGPVRARSVPMTVELTEYSRPHRLGSVTRMKSMDVRGTLTFEPTGPTGEGTRMRWSWSLDPHGALRRAGPVVTWLGRRQEQRIWGNLKRYLETEPARGSLQS